MSRFSLPTRLMCVLLSTLLLFATLSGCSASIDEPLESQQAASVIATLPSPTQLCTSAAVELGADTVQQCVEGISPFLANIAVPALPPETAALGPIGFVVALVIFLVTISAFLLSYYESIGLDTDEIIDYALGTAIPQYGSINANLQLLASLTGLDAWAMLQAQGRAVQFTIEQVGEQIAVLLEEQVDNATDAAKEWLNKQPNFPTGWCGKWCQGVSFSIVLALLASVFSGSVQRTIEDDAEDFRPRTAYVLGAGADPLSFSEDAAFLFLLSRHYDHIYVNDRESPTWEIDVVEEYAKYCESGSTLNREAGLRYLCDEVTSPPSNLDFRYMGMPANQIPGPIEGVDIYVMFPDPEWLWGNFDELDNNLGADLRQLVGKNTQAFVITELPPEDSFQDQTYYFDTEGLYVTPSTFDTTGQLKSGNKAQSLTINYSLLYNSRINNFVTITSTHLEEVDNNLFTISK